MPDLVRVCITADGREACSAMMPRFDGDLILWALAEDRSMRRPFRARLVPVTGWRRMLLQVAAMIRGQR